MFRTISIIGLLIGLLFPAGCATRGTLPAVLPAFDRPLYHSMTAGETLWGISKQYNVEVHELMEANDISDPTNIETGRIIRIPTLGKIGRTELAARYGEKPRWKYIVIHHSATAEGNAEIFDRSHRRRGFWNGLGYHFLICNGTSGTRDGQIQVGDRWIKQIEGAHCNVGDMNEVGIGICLVGDFENDGYATPRQLASLKRLVRSLQESQHISEENVVRHLDVKPSTKCPGRHFPWQQFKATIHPRLETGLLPLFAESESYQRRRDALYA